MSNLLKYRNVKCDNNDKKVIDYNALITEKIAQIQQKIEFEQHQDMMSEEFVEGIDAESVEMLLNDDSNVIRESNMANERAEEIIALANADAEAIIEDAKQECVAIKQAAMASGRNEGYQEGKVRAAKELESQRKLLEEERQSLQSQYEQKLKNMESELVDTILTVFSKVTHVLAEDKKDIVMKLVDDALAKNEFNSDLLIRVSSADYKFVMDNKASLSKVLHGNMQLEVVEDPTFSKGQCMIETDSGIYDCSLDIQLGELINDIKMLSCMAD